MLHRINTSSGNFRIFFVIIILVTILYTTNVFFDQKDSKNILKDQNQIFHHSQKTFEIYTPSCKIPHMSPFDPAVLPYVNNKQKVFCSNKTQLIISNDTHLMFNLEALEDYSLESNESLDCYYQNFWRLEPKINQKDSLLKFGKKIYFNSTTQIDGEFLRVICKIDKKEIFKDFYAFVPIQRIKPKIKSSDKKLNILIIGLDSVSRLNFHRQMPLTNDFIQKELGGVEYFGYNKIGDNTFPNLVPVLTGLNETELVKTCWPTKDSKFDNCSLIWKEFQENGYVTAFAEEAAWMGLFNYLKYGFVKQPVTHMWGTFDRIAENEIGYKGLNSRICQGTKFTLEYLLEYNLRFVRRYKTVDQNYFGLFWESSFSHDGINYDPKVDQLYKEFLKNLALTEALENTILFFMSDHGIRWGDILNTYQGRLEERLPFFFVVTPKWFQEQYPEVQKNILENSRKLTSHWDLRETLKSILHNDFSADPIKSSRGISLFRPVPINRTCESAGIPPHWCTCQENLPLSPNDKLAHLATTFIITHINNLLSNHTYCAKVLLDKVIDASASKSNNFDKKVKEVHYITIVFRTKFVGAIFEATVKCRKCDKLKNFELGGPISRHNLYGHQGDCIQDSKLRLYCYCKM